MEEKRAISRENQERCTQVFRKVDKEWVFKKRHRGHVICRSAAGTKNQCNQSKDDKQSVSHKCRLCVTIQTDRTLTHNRPDIILGNIQKWTIIDTAVPGDFNVDRT